MMQSTFALLLLGVSVPFRGTAVDDVVPKAVAKVEAVDQYCTGKVVEVTRDSITILPDGLNKPRRFAVSSVLAKGDYPRDRIPPCRYKLSDVNAGDIVGIDYDRIGGVDICHAVGIRRRPGGKIPPGHYPADLIDPPHELAQALQDNEEYGIPLPEKYQMKGRPAAIAPPPREAKVGEATGRAPGRQPWPKP